MTDNFIIGLSSGIFLILIGIIIWWGIKEYKEDKMLQKVLDMKLNLIKEIIAKEESKQNRRKKWQQ